ncbi:MAG: hypothetical protein EOP45_19245, partial [Sphingobacteriaceae bacterium]
MNATYPTSLNHNYSGFRVSSHKWKHAIICFQFDHYDKKLKFGIALTKDPNKDPIPTELKIQLNTLPNNNPKSSVWWPWYNEFESPYNDWSKYDAWEAVVSGKMMELFLEKMNYLVKITNGINVGRSLR